MTRKYCEFCGVYLKTSAERDREICDDCYDEEDPEEVDFDDTAACIANDNSIPPNF